MNKSVNIALFGGTFNPVHNGHLINARHILREFSLNKVIFIPSRYPVHKKLESGISVLDRCAMLSLAIQDDENFEISSIEVDRDSPSYAIFTVMEMSGIYEECSMHYIIGADSYNQLTTWKDHIRLFALTRFIVLRRPGEQINKSRYPGYEDRFRFANNPLLEISSREIRELVNSGRSAHSLVPGPVYDYINEKGLYRD